MKATKSKSSKIPNNQLPSKNQMLVELENFIMEKNKTPASDSDNHEPKSSNSFISFKGSKGQQMFVRKSSCLWAWERNKERVSTDRVFRFIKDQKKDKPIDKKYLTVGDFACFVAADEIIIGRVLGFTYLSGKRKEYTLPYCPLKPEIENEKKRGIAVLCTQYFVGDKTLIPKNTTDYVNIDFYKLHVDVEEIGQEFRLTTDSYKDVVMFF